MQLPFKEHAYRQQLLEKIGIEMKKRKQLCLITKEDYENIVENMKKEDNGEILKKDTHSMTHLIIVNDPNEDDKSVYSQVVETNEEEKNQEDICLKFVEVTP